MTLQIGVLALQGDFQAHSSMLSGLGVQSREVRRPAHLRGLHGIVLPGGESTTMWTFLEALDMSAALRTFAQHGGALYGTCAGVILLAKDIRNPQRSGLGLLDITVERNGYGRQTDSTIHRVPLSSTAADRVEAPTDRRLASPPNDTAASNEPADPFVEIVLIRAPRIVRMGTAVRCHLRWQGDALWVEQDRIMGTTFHPELGTDTRFHRRFLQLATEASQSMATA